MKLNLNNKELEFSKEDDKESIVSKCGQPDGNVGNGCYIKWPEPLVYDECEFHFKNDKLTLIIQKINNEIVKIDIN